MLDQARRCFRSPNDGPVREPWRRGRHPRPVLTVGGVIHAPRDAAIGPIGLTLRRAEKLVRPIASFEDVTERHGLRSREDADFLIAREGQCRHPEADHRRGLRATGSSRAPTEYAPVPRASFGARARGTRSRTPRARHARMLAAHLGPRGVGLESADPGRPDLLTGESQHLIRDHLSRA